MEVEETAYKPITLSLIFQSLIFTLVLLIASLSSKPVNSHKKYCSLHTLSIVASQTLGIAVAWLGWHLGAMEGRLINIEIQKTKNEKGRRSIPGDTQHALLCFLSSSSVIRAGRTLIKHFFLLHVQRGGTLVGLAVP